MNKLLPFCAVFIFFFTQQSSAQNIQGSIDSLDSPQVIRPDSSFVHSGHSVKYSLKKDSIDWLDYHSLPNVSRYIPGVSVFELGAYGHPTLISLNGSDGNQFSLSRGTENINDLITGVPDPNVIALEATDSIVVYPQHQAFYYGGNGKLFSANAYEKTYDAARPYSRIRHVESPYDGLYTDVIFSVNPTEKSNVMSALTRQSSGTTGIATTALDMKLPNAGYDAWSLRGTYRINFSDRSFLTFKDHYDHFVRMYNGGVNPYGTSVFNADSAFGFTPTLVNSTMQDDLVRNRMEGEYSFHLFGDTLHSSVINVSYTSNVFTFLDRMDRSPDSLTRLNAKTVWDDVRLLFEHESEISHLAFHAGGSLDRYQIRRSPYITDRAGINLEAHGKLRLTIGKFSTDIFGRLENTFGLSSIGFGATAMTHINSDFSFWVGASYSEHSPTLFETSWASSRVSRGNDLFKNEHFTIGESGIRFSSHFLDVELRGFYRFIQNPIQEFVSQTERNLSRFMTDIIPNELQNYYTHEIGSTMNCRLQFWKFYSESRIALTKQISQNLITNDNQTLFSGSTDLYFRDVLIQNALEVKAGLRCDFSASNAPYTLNPETGVFARSNISPALNAIVVNYVPYQSLNLYVFANIKTATIHFILQNLFDARYITTTFYPMYERGVRFGVSWAFFD